MALCIGCGLYVNGAGKLEVQRKPGGGVNCEDGTGLWVAPPTRSDENCNGLQVRGNGSLYAVCPATVAGLHDYDSGVSAMAGINVAGSNNTYFFPGAVTTITNTLCCPVTGRVTVSGGGMEIQLHQRPTGGDPAFKAQAYMQVKTNGGPWTDASPSTLSIVCNNGTGDIVGEWNNMYESFWLAGGSMPAGGVVTYEPRLVVTIIGAAAVAGSIGGLWHWELQWNLTQTGCC